MSDIDQLIDRFVATLNNRGLEALPLDSVPEELRVGDPDEYFAGWQIRRAILNPWVEELEQELPAQFPKLYHSLIARYRFAELQVGPIMLLANSGHSLMYELKDKMFCDPHLSTVLLENGFLHFGHPYAGDYDPICFATRKGKDGDAPIVQLDHEDILIRDGRITVVEEMAPSFRTFVERVIAREIANEP